MVAGAMTDPTQSAAHGEDGSSLSRLGAAALAEGRIDEAVRCYRQLDAAEGRPGDITQAYTPQHLDRARALRGEPYFRWLEDVAVETAYWTIMKDGVVYNDDVHAKNLRSSPFVRGRVSTDGATVIATLPPPSMELAQACILVGGDDNYSHWLFRNMLKLSTLDRAGMLFDYPWLVNSDLLPHQTEYVTLLGQRTERLIKVERSVVITCKRLLVPALLTSIYTIAEGVRWIRERFARLLAAPAQASRRIFVSRRDVARRKLLNEDEIFAALAPLGFERVVPGELGVAEQIATFSAARVIVAAHGAALTNMVFAPPSAAIVELSSTAIEHMDLFRKLARSTQQRIVTLMSADYDVPAHDVGVNTDYRVDPREVRRAVEQIL